MLGCLIFYQECNLTIWDYYWWVKLIHNPSFNIVENLGYERFINIKTNNITKNAKLKPTQLSIHATLSQHKLLQHCCISSCMHLEIKLYSNACHIPCAVFDLLGQYQVRLRCDSSFFSFTHSLFEELVWVIWPDSNSGYSKSSGWILASISDPFSYYCKELLDLLIIIFLLFCRGITLVFPLLFHFV